MKKIVLFATALMSVTMLSGCKFIKDAIDPEKQYSFNEYKSLLAERDFKAHSYTKATLTAEATIDGSKEESEEPMVFTWNEELGKWQDPTDEGKVFEFQVMSSGEIRKDVASITDTKGYTFFARKDSYRIVNAGSDTDEEYEWQWSFDKDGLLTETHIKLKDLVKMTKKEGSVKVSYSK